MSRLTIQLCVFFGCVALSSGLAFHNNSYAKQCKNYDATGPEWPKFAVNSSDTVHVHVHPETDLLKASEYFFGANLPLYLKSASMVNETAYAHIIDAGITVLRYPGGSSANKWLWDGDFDTYPYFASSSWMNAESNTNMSDFATILHATNTKPLVELNAAFALVYGADVAAEYFIAMHEAFLALGVNVTYYEFGNENYGAWEPPYGDYPVNGTLYGECFVYVAEALKKAYPYIQVGAVVLYDDNTSSEDDDFARLTAGAVAGSLLKRGGSDEHEDHGYGATIPDWTEQVIQVPGAMDQADFFIVHEYFYKGDSDEPKDVTLLKEPLLLKNYTSWFQTTVDKYVPGASVPPLILSEFALAQITSNACGSTEDYISALWEAKLIGESLFSQLFAALTTFSYADSSSECDEKDHGDYGDYGLVSKDNPDRPDGSPYPKFIAHVLLKLAVGDTVVPSQVKTANSKVRVYASTFAGGEVGVLLINEDPYNAAKIKLEGTTNSTNLANSWIVTGQELNNTNSDTNPLHSTTVYWNDQSDALGEGFPPDETYLPYRLESKENGVFHFPIPPASLVGVVVYPSSDL